jgi:hypothetical protein
MSIADKANITPKSGYLERTLTMALSPVEISMDDCQTNYSLNVLIFSKKHAKSLVGKYYRDPDNISSDWKVLDYKTAKSFINRKVYIRSPITCEAPHFKICKKCFGARNFPTKYVGVVSGQIVSERITQLIMRSFHSSGSANLKIYDSTKLFIENHLIDIIEDDEYVKLKFDDNHFPATIQQINGYHDIDPINNIVVFKPIKEPVENIDVVSVLNDMQNILKSDKHIKKHPSEYYQELIEHLLNVGTPYSSFIEILLCNMFLTDKEENIFWRYNQDKKAIRKFGDRNLAHNLSATLGCLFQPNKNTLSNMVDIKDNDINTMSIYEKIWYGIFDE